MPPRSSAILGFCALALIPAFQGPAAPEGSPEDLRRRFLSAREESPNPVVTAKSSKKSDPQSGAGSKARPKPKAKPTPKPGPASKPKTPPAPPSATPVDGKKGTAPSESKDKTAPPSVQPAAPAPPGVLPPSATPLKAAPAKEEAPVLVEKSGFDPRNGYQPPALFGWFTKWRFLSKSLREEIDQAPVQKARWRYIVVHNSGTRQGNARAFEYYHSKVRKMSNGLAYHFVIGNGTSSGDGEIEVGNRWRRQINGGHVHSDYLNNISLGICLVGDFNQDKPTQKQLDALDELIRYLRQRTGKIDGKWAVVKAHREINPPRWPTDCPGSDFPYSWLHKRFD